ncbi:15-hydroxyprostaglandin dehydrogenase [NAD(+)]-like [Diorhabda carinulata]|uniref:15-hydroxyprostaglandin dehydrogenase [NAD(+)]-like n=1 Tax=Diorhabda carinulata TaxID=1163345 RepID=UPI0025A0FB58|nr:15-hydroxyprostaglandin dehydrogenase [NAD(+)]-like [Diorhabda carinulata]
MFFKKVFTKVPINWLRNAATAAEIEPLLDINCKTAVITGGTGGIGYATANHLLCNGVKHVALIGLNSYKGAQAVENLNCVHGQGRSHFVTCDVRDRRALSNTINSLKKDYENLDIFVNSAGYWNDSDWCQELNTNLNGTINVNLEIAAALCKSNAVVVNLTGNFGLEPFPPSPIFAAANSAIVEFTRSFGHKTNSDKFGLRVVALCTGITKTDFVKSLDKKMLTAEMGQDLNEFLKMTPTQNADSCAKAVIDVIRYAKNGSVWIVEDSKLFAAKLVDWRGQSVVISYYN